MPKPTRLLPRHGAQVRITHFGGEVELGTIVGMQEGGRRLQVRCEDRDAEFVLSEATAKFVAAGPAGGARLELLA